MKLNKTEIKLIAQLKFYETLGMTQIASFTMRRAARSLRDKEVVTIEQHKHEASIWIIRCGKNKDMVQ